MVPRRMGENEDAYKGASYGRDPSRETKRQRRTSVRPSADYGTAVEAADHLWDDLRVGWPGSSSPPNGFGAWRSLASALDWGSRGRRFKSCRPDLQVLVV